MERWNDGILEVFFGIVGRQTECVTRYASRAVDVLTDYASMHAHDYGTMPGLGRRPIQ